MRRTVPFVVFTLLIRLALADEKPTDLPWKVNKPIVTVKKSLYLHTPERASFATSQYVGPNLELLETNSVVIVGDQPFDMKQRLSTDNGKTWSVFQPLNPPSIMADYNGVKVGECHGPRFYDSQVGVLVETWLRRPASDNFTTYWRLSWDHGATWSTPQVLRYEEGDDFDPKNPLAPGFLSTNQGYFGNNIIKLSNGTLVTVLGSANTPGGGPRSSSLCFIGTWKPAAKDYQWTPGNRVAVPPDKSTELTEPEVAELKDGRVLVIWRGCNTAITPGRKWYSVSKDGGMTLSPVAELKYDDGSSFYSSASYHRMVRSSATGKLYWLGNITATPPDTWLPRYPLVISEVDETGPIPSLKKETVTSIEDRQPGQPDWIQFSNFNLRENRESHTLEFFMTYADDSYKYVVTLVR